MTVGGATINVNVNTGGSDATATSESEGGDPGPDPMVTICHMPGTPAEQTLEIPVSALRGHLNHGDTLGACPVTVDPIVEEPVVEEPDCRGTCSRIDPCLRKKGHAVLVGPFLFCYELYLN